MYRNAQKSLPAVNPQAINIVHMDPMTPEQKDRALYLIRTQHAHRPFLGPVSVRMSVNGFTFNEGEIVTQTPEEIARRFERQLKNGDERALRLNQILCGGG